MLKWQATVPSMDRAPFVRAKAVEQLCTLADQLLLSVEYCKSKRIVHASTVVYLSIEQKPGTPDSTEPRGTMLDALDTTLVRSSAQNVPSPRYA